MKFRHFSSDAEVVAVAGTWLDGQHSEYFLSGLQKLQQRAKKCIEFRGEYVEEIPSFVAVTRFLPGRAKDLPAPPLIHKNCLRLFLSWSRICLNDCNFRCSHKTLSSTCNPEYTTLSKRTAYLTLWRRNSLLNFSTPVFKMQIIQEPKKAAL